MEVPVYVTATLLPPIDSPEAEREETYDIEELIYVDIEDCFCRAWQWHDHGDDPVTNYEVDDYELREAALAALPLPDGKEDWEVYDFTAECC